VALIAFPGGGVRPKFVKGSMELVGADGVIEFFGGGTQVTSFNKGVWAASFELPPLQGIEFAQWRAFLVQMRRLENVAELTPLDSAVPTTGYSGPDANVAGAGQLGSVMTVDGLTPNTPILLEGDYFDVFSNGFSELKMAIAPATSDSSGVAVFNFEPALRNAPADNASVSIAIPKARFRFVEPRARWNFDLLRLGGFRINATEAFTS
jgi:hypothetical protein